MHSETVQRRKDELLSSDGFVHGYILRDFAARHHIRPRICKPLYGIVITSGGGRPGFNEVVWTDLLGERRAHRNLVNRMFGAAWKRFFDERERV